MHLSRAIFRLFRIADASIDYLRFFILHKLLRNLYIVKKYPTNIIKAIRCAKIVWRVEMFRVKNYKIFLWKTLREYRRLLRLRMYYFMSLVDFLN